VAELGRSLNKEPDVISLDPIYLSDVLEDIRQVGRATGAEARAESLTRELQVRIDAVVARTSQAAASPRVLQLEWADPLMCGGHWVVEMVELAGGTNCFGHKDHGSSRLEWPDVVASQPEVVILMPCGFGLERSLEDMPILAEKEGWDTLPAVRDNRVFVIDAAAYTSRLGPRLVTGLEIMAEIIHPELFSGMIPEGAVARWDGG
jgi:iron complex transport system substrate-binding protein